MSDYDISSPSHRDKIAFEIHNNIDKYCETVYDGGHRSHLGASLIGDPCARKLWYTFRWAKHHKHTGRMHRLFNRGHREEERFVEWLRGAGIEVFDFAEDGRQHRISAIGGHFGGSLDGIGILPFNGEKVLLEFKTYNAKSFKRLVENGMRDAKPMHFAQTSVYGKHYGLKYVLYLAICKNDDELHVELVELDWALASDLERKAEYIITAQEVPPRCCSSESHFQAKMCEYKSLCWEFNMTLDKNCRSCANCRPVDNGGWYCDEFNAEVPQEFISTGCDNWKPIVK